MLGKEPDREGGAIIGRSACPLPGLCILTNLLKVAGFPGHETAVEWRYNWEKRRLQLSRCLKSI